TSSRSRRSGTARSNGCARSSRTAAEAGRAPRRRARGKLGAMSDLERILAARDRDFGDFTVGRVLPAIERRFLGPFALLDHMASAGGVAVKPHPHLHLATVTYLFAGEIMHRDSLGSAQPIVPGDINWMSAGTGIVHSERAATGP